MTSVSGVKNLGTDLPDDTDQVDQRQDIIILGSFKRGRVDKPFKVTKTNYRAKLGFDYQNHHYMTVEDLLNNGAPYVWIQHVQAPQDSFSEPLNLVLSESNGGLLSKWTNSFSVDYYNLYISETSMLPGQLPAPRKSNFKDLSYLDLTVESGKTYYVRVGAVKYGIEKLSDEASLYVNLPFGDWIVNNAVSTLSSSMARYSAYQTNQKDFNDSYADLDLTDAVVKSLSDADMQQWQAVKDAANQLTGVTNWTIDTVNKKITYKTGVIIYSGYTATGYGDRFPTPLEACAFYFLKTATFKSYRLSGKITDASQTFGFRYNCTVYSQANYTGGSMIAYITANESAEESEKSISFLTIAQKILSNTLSTDQGISLLAEAYRENVAKSLFNTDPAKQFVKRSDLISQFDANKVLRPR